jgi:hypothetical protein
MGLNMNSITETSLNLFLEYAKDAANWNGMPLVGGNVGGTKEERGNLTQLKKAGLITTIKEDDFVFIKFTDEGKKLALQHDIEIIY